MIGGGLGRVQLVDGGGEASTAALPLLGGHTILASTFSSAGTEQFFIIGGENGLLQVLHAGGKAKSEPASVIDGRVEATNCGARKNRCLVVSWNEDQQTSDMRLITYDGQPVGASRVLFDGHRVTALRFVASAWGPAADPGGSFIAGATGGKIRVIDSYGKPSGVEVTALHGADILAIDWFGPGWLIGGAEGKLQLLFVGDRQSQRLSYRVSELGDVRSISCHRRLCLVIGSGGKAVVLEKKFKPGRSNDAKVQLADGGALSLLGGKQAYVACADFSGPQHRWLVAGEEGLTQVVEIDVH